MNRKPYSVNRKPNTVYRIPNTLIKFLFKLQEREIEYNDEIGAYFAEAFNHPTFKNASPAQQLAWGFQWAETLYQLECEIPLDRFYPNIDLRQFCEGKRLLDIGCYVGGKTIRWLDKYGGAEIVGLDVDVRALRIANRWAEERGAQATFSAGISEQLPFPDNSFDVILSVNTFEHVHDLPQALAECRRVLRPNGVALVQFLTVFYPAGHHLDLVTRTPCMQWLFSYERLLQVYFEVLDERGVSAEWYTRPERYPLPYERGYTTNGVSAREFDRLVRRDWHVLYDRFDIIESHSPHPIKRFMELYLKRLRLPILRELYEIAYILQK